MASTPQQMTPEKQPRRVARRYGVAELFGRAVVSLAPDVTRYDPLTKAERSERMSRIRNVDTKPEMVVRRLIHKMGYRYALHARDLPGNPDLVFRPRRKVIFVHGCFWHQHGCRHYRQPRTKQAFWQPKLARNQARDEEVRKMLRKQGWKTMTVWECQLTRTRQLSSRLRRFLGNEA